MRMPYWQFLLHIGLLSFAVHRVVAAMVVPPSDARVVLVVCFGAQALFGVIAAIAMWLKLRAQIISVVALASVVVLSSLVQAFALGAWAVPMSVAQALIALLVATGVIKALQYADAHPEGTRSN